MKAAEIQEIEEQTGDGPADVAEIEEADDDDEG